MTKEQNMAARSFEMTIDLDATPDEVWRALTDAGELVRWLPVQARVTPGVGGTMIWGWDDGFSWESRIDVWEPGKRLVLTEDRPPTDIKGTPIQGAPQKLAMEFTLETHAGRTRLRLVHSGFGHGANWDDEIEGISAGWQFELRGLRHYLERHKGRDRLHAAVHGSAAVPRVKMWQRLLGPELFTIEGPLADGALCTISSAAGHRLHGRVFWHNPGRDLAVVVDEAGGGLFRISVWNAVGRTGAQVWLTTYDAAHAATVQDFGRSIAPLVKAITGG